MLVAVRLAGLLIVLVSLAACAAPEPDSVVLVTVDTLRADRLGAYGHRAARTPNFDALAAESLLFEHAWAHSSSTLPSIASLLTGVLPGRHQLVANIGTLNPRFETLATRMQEHGLTTAAFVGSWVLRPDRGLARGFDRYTESWGPEESNRPQPETMAGPMTDEILAWLDELAPGERVFLWAHYQDPHGPYEPPDHEPAGPGGPELPRSADMSGIGAIPRYQWLGHGRLAEYEARYDGEITEMDRHLGRLLDGLRERGILQRSTLVFTADHGEAFGEGDLYCAHGEGLGEVLLRVPLLLHGPGIEPGVRADDVRLVDVVPTLLGRLGLAPGPGMPGISLLEERGDREIVAQVHGSKRRQWRSLRNGGIEIVESGEGVEMRRVDGSDAPIPRAESQRLVSRIRHLARWPRALPPASSPRSPSRRRSSSAPWATSTSPDSLGGRSSQGSRPSAPPRADRERGEERCQGSQRAVRKTRDRQQDHAAARLDRGLQPEVGGVLLRRELAEPDGRELVGVDREIVELAGLQSVVDELVAWAARRAEVPLGIDRPAVGEELLRVGDFAQRRCGWVGEVRSHRHRVAPLRWRESGHLEDGAEEVGRLDERSRLSSSRRRRHASPATIKGTLSAPS